MELLGGGALAFFCAVGGIYAVWLLWDCHVRWQIPLNSKSMSERNDWWCQAVAASIFLIVAIALISVLWKGTASHVAKRIARERQLRETIDVRGLPPIAAVNVARNQEHPNCPVQGIDLAFQPISDANIRELVEAEAEIEYLILTGTSITDESVVRLAKMTRLKQLSLRNTHITDAACASLAQLTLLEDLSLSDTPITDAGLEKLTTLTNLESFDIRNTRVTDAGLVALENCQCLKVLDVGETRVTAQALASLKKKLPSLTQVSGPSEK